MIKYGLFRTECLWRGKGVLAFWSTGSSRPGDGVSTKKSMNAGTFARPKLSPWSVILLSLMLPPQRPTMPGHMPDELDFRLPEQRRMCSDRRGLSSS